LGGAVSSPVPPDRGRFLRPRRHWHRSPLPGGRQRVEHDPAQRIARHPPRRRSHEGHIERRATELAAPLIAAAQADAEATIAEARFELQRKDDLISELRKRLAMQDRHLADYLKAKREAALSGKPVTIRA
jgi:hypothetical protein